MTDDQNRLLSHVRPPGWQNPTPAPKYDLVVIGGGTAGLVCAVGAAGLGARVALVERLRLGGDCLNTGCVPSKALLRSAQAVADADANTALGVTSTARVDFASVMARLRARRADLAPHDSASRLAAAGVDTFFGTAAFVDRRTVGVSPDAASSGPWSLAFRKAVVATGSRPALPALPGLSNTPFLTSETLFDIEQQPRDLVIVGAGPVGCEMAQAFARLGTRVRLIESAGQILPREDTDAAAIVRKRLGAEGVAICTGVRLTGTRIVDGRITVSHEGGAESADVLLVAAGREPRREGLGLDVAGIDHDHAGIKVDDRLRTSNPNVYAAGDVCSGFKFTHAADAMARVVIQNALFGGRRRASRLVIPWCTFTSPEVAHVGMNSAKAAAAGASTITVPLASVDRAVIDDATEGFVRVHHDGGRILGATIVAEGAGELIGTVVLAMRHGQGLAELSSAIFPYPTLTSALRQAGDEYQRGRLTSGLRRLLQYYLRVLR